MHTYAHSYPRFSTLWLTNQPQEGLGTIRAIDTNGRTQVQIEGLGDTSSNVVLDRKCLIALNWPVIT